MDMRQRVLLVVAALLLAWPAAPVPARAASLSIAVSGNHLIDGNGQAVRLLGVDRSGTEYACIQGWGIFDGPSDAASIQAIASWHVNTVRLPLNEDCWLAINGAAAAYSGATYRNAIVNYVNLLHASGMYAILDLHWNAAGTAQATGQQAMVDADHGPAFWSSVAATFKSDPAVLFDLYNEPEFISWSCWRDGTGCPVSWAVAGMQSLVSAVRAAGATQPIMLGGVAYSNDLSQWLAYEPSDPQGALVASLHTYNFNTCNTTSCWDSQVAPVAARVPVVAGEIGEDDGGHGFIDSFMAWADSKNISYLAWTWDTWGCGNTPVLIADYSGTPCQTFGAGYKAHLLHSAPARAGWERLSATMTSAPAVSSWGTNRLDVFARGQDLALYHTWWDGASWHPWQRIAATMSSAPAAVSSGSSRIEVFARGQDLALYHIFTNDGGTTWSAWQRLAASMTSAPAVSSSATGRLDAFGRGQDMALYHTWSTDGGTTWTSWERLNGSLTSDPAAASSTSGRLDVFARGNDLALYQQTYDASGWHGWVRLGGTLASSPAASSWSSGRLDVFAMGQDQATYHLVSSDGTTWQPWVRLAGPWTSAPAAASQTTNSIDVFERGPDLALYHDHLTG